VSVRPPQVSANARAIRGEIMDANGIIGNFRSIVTEHYVDFQGRARRAQYWYYMLVYVVIFIVLAIIQQVIGMRGLLTGLLGLALLLPSLGLAFRRIHDTDRSAWWLLIGLIPIIGALVLIYFFIQPGTSGSNTYGADPKAA
jgi:uncharacterized membrane protein YhaH (DUF805 family)